MKARSAISADMQAVCEIYNQGIEEGNATFETRPRRIEDIEAWFGGIHPVVVVERDGIVVGFAATYPYRKHRECYSGVAEFSVYVARDSRCRGAGRLVMQELIRTSGAVGFWKLLSRLFPENVASRSLLNSVGFREVGLYRNHAQLDGRWRDVVVVEYLIEKNLATGCGRFSGGASFD